MAKRRAQVLERIGGSLVGRCRVAPLRPGTHSASRRRPHVTAARGHAGRAIGSVAAVAGALAVAALGAGCGDVLLSKESRAEIAAVRAAVESRAEAVNQPTPTNELPIVVAMRTDSSSLAAWLLARGASATARDTQGRTPLHAAVTYDRPSYALLRALLARGHVDVNVADDRGVTPLHVAAQVLQPEAIDIFVHAGADPNRPDALGRTPVHELGALLLPPDPRLPPPDPKSAAAQPAAAAATMDRLLKAGGRLDAADAQGRRPLHVYALSGNVAAVRAALAHGADVSAVDARGQTPLFQASAFARADVVALLIAAGADLRHRDAQGLTALEAMRYTAPEPVDAPKVAAMLRAAGARDTATAAKPDAAVATRSEPIARDLRGEQLAAQSGEVLVAGTYIDAPELRGFAGTFRTPPATALCSDVDRLEAIAPQVTVTRCRSPRCPNGECPLAQCEGAGPRDMEYREVAIGGPCKALAFFRATPGLSPGRPVEPAVAIEPTGGDRSATQWRFRFRGHVYALSVTDRW
jgi:ankyrin repeat protein